MLPRVTFYTSHKKYFFNPWMNDIVSSKNTCYYRFPHLLNCTEYGKTWCPNNLINLMDFQDFVVFINNPAYCKDYKGHLKHKNAFFSCTQCANIDNGISSEMRMWTFKIFWFLWYLLPVPIIMIKWFWC